MPKKTVLEMNAFERLHYSLGGKTFRAIVAVTLIVGLAALGFGFYLYYSSIDREYRVKTWHMSRAEAEVIDRYEVLREAMIVTRIYDRLSEEERQAQDTDEYKALFNEVSLHVDFAKMRAHLYHIMEANEAKSAMGRAPGGYLGALTRRILSSYRRYSGRNTTISVKGSPVGVMAAARMRSTTTA